VIDFVTDAFLVVLVHFLVLWYVERFIGLNPSWIGLLEATVICGACRLICHTTAEVIFGFGHGGEAVFFYFPYLLVTLGAMSALCLCWQEP